VVIDLTSEMAGLWAALGPAPAGQGRVIQFVSATGGEGTSTVAREFARLAAVRARKPVWLIDADLNQQDQQEAVAAEPTRFGRLGAVAHASPDGSSFFSIAPALVTRDGRPVRAARLLTARPALGGRLWVSRFRAEALRSGQRATVIGDAAYWQAMRRHADTVVIDTPAADRSGAALTLAPVVDATVLVLVSNTAPADPMTLRDRIEGVGGRIAGLVINRSTWRPSPLLKRMLG